MDIKQFQQLPILGILRGIEESHVEPLVAIIESAGLKTIEITMNTKGAPALIRKAVAISKGRLTIGAGTVLDMASLHAALDAGATFIVMPVLVPDVMAYCVKHNIRTFPGAFSPQEIFTAWRAGATMVKVFPTSALSPEYFSEIKGPFADIKLLACGGVTAQNMKSYFAHGADAVSFGASVFKKEWLAKKDFSSIGLSIKEFLQEFSLLKTGFPKK
ncbi:MAG: bifunctional 4-hydroxy-2-oxoglutarate aldolase/2-dehydro-3-deoxy-phosphogluconate aldolase [Candidatus Omnitrophica bacterium]|nr:bifunctional 4-hydroxy-2-oxoglutarate aldolase/2-dehydro-3-deoxy-phosphogluconate aldolase [Candidatus Omnitrophota bacterium]